MPVSSNRVWERACLGATAGRSVTAVMVLLLGVVAGACSDDKADAESSERETTTTVDRSARLEELIEVSGLEDPAVIKVPPAGDGETVNWLNGEGAAAVGLVTASEDLWAEGEPACESTAEALEAVGTPEQILVAAAGTPDEPTREILVNLHRFTGDTLTACADAEAFEPAVAQLAWHWAIADQRLEQLGVNR